MFHWTRVLEVLLCDQLTLLLLASVETTHPGESSWWSRTVHLMVKKGGKGLVGDLCVTIRCTLKQDCWLWSLPFLHWCSVQNVMVFTSHTYTVMCYCITGPKVRRSTDHGESPKTVSQNNPLQFIVTNYKLVISGMCNGDERLTHKHKRSAPLSAGQNKTTMRYFFTSIRLAAILKITK